MIAKLVKGKEKYLYRVSMILFGIVFLMHGLMKFGIPGDMMVASLSMMWWAGVIEIVVGVMLIGGLFVRLGALFGAIEMLVAFFMVHAPNGLNPLQNNGEPAVLFFAAFLIFLAYGNGPGSLEKMLLKKEHF